MVYLCKRDKLNVEIEDNIILYGINRNQKKEEKVFKSIKYVSKK